MAEEIAAHGASRYAWRSASANTCRSENYRPASASDSGLQLHQHDASLPDTMHRLKIAVDKLRQIDRVLALPDYAAGRGRLEG